MESNLTSLYDQILVQVPKMYLNVFLAITLGILVDWVFNRMNINNTFVRMILQFGLGMIIVIVINYYYSMYNLNPAQSGPFFTSVFLAVQLTLFNDVYSLSKLLG